MPVREFFLVETSAIEDEPVESRYIFVGEDGNERNEDKAAI
jgi:hypothetical protein